MVRILEAENGRQTQLVTVDVDTLLDVRAASTATHDAADRLISMGFEPDLSEGSVTYRFTREDAIVDVLAPDGVGERASTTTVPPAGTIRAIGGTQALNRTRKVLLDDGEGAFEVPVPSLIGAIVIKAGVAGLTQADDGRAKHERDLARLLALVDDPYAMSEELGRSDRRHLRARGALISMAHPAWLGSPEARNGALALAILVGESKT